MGYTQSEIEVGESEGQDEWAETASEWSDEDRQLLAEEAREAQENNNIWGSEEENQSRETEWTDLDRRMFQEKLDAEREVPW